MTGSEALIVGEGWISEHYFTTDATSQSFTAKVAERRKLWDAESAEHRPTPRSRFTEKRQELEVAFGGLGELIAPDVKRRNLSAIRQRAGVIHDLVLTVLELGPVDQPQPDPASGGDAAPVSPRVRPGQHGLLLDRDGALIRVSQAGMTDRAPLAIVLAAPCAELEDVLAKSPQAFDAGDAPAGSTLREPVRLEEDGPELTSAARLTSELFVAEDAPTLVLILSGRWAVLAERERWAEGRYLAVDLQLVCERNDTRRGGEIDRALTCLEAASIGPDADGTLWWTAVFEESVKHTVGVSKELRDGVRVSIEIIANDVVTRRAEQGMPPLPGEQAQPLAKQALRYLYRILFLLYAEASPELAVLPVNAPEYDRGYSLDRLRDLVQVPLAGRHARSGTHLYASLDLLFALVDGRRQSVTTAVPADGEDDTPVTPGLTFNPLRADLFRPAATALIDEVRLGNVALQQVLGHLLLSKEKRGRDRGFISYAELGINQLGAVYEGLMSYTGFFAETDLYEVAKGGDGSKGSWVVPTDRIDGISDGDFIRETDPQTGEPRPVLHPRGSFVFRLAGRERQQSASYYTPEVLTRFTVGQALEELLDQDGATTSAAEILELTVCEPALGSGAFAIEAVRQLAAQYLQRRQDERGIRIDPDEYPRELQRVKAFLALHNVYGVDLNATAVELAEISLWLDTMVAGLAAPWFGLRLRRGNSLIGARRAVYRRAQVATNSWLGAVPTDVPLASLAADVDADRDGDAGGVHHFLLPAAGWGSSVEAKEATVLAPDATARLKKWRGAIKAKPSKAQVDALVELSHRVEALWRISLQRQRIADSEARRTIPVWGHDATDASGTVQREEIERVLADPDGAYQRLRRVMDAWCGLWFWPLTTPATTVETPDGPRRVEPPTLDQWIAGLQALLGRSIEHSAGRNRPTGPTLASSIGWDALNDAEQLDLQFAGATPIDRALVQHPWLQVTERVAQRQGFFHWELDFAPVFARAGGFDLQLGNPPWVKPDVDIAALLAEGDPWWALTLKPSESLAAAKRSETLDLPGIQDFVVESVAETIATREFVSCEQQFPLLVGLRPDLYRCFMQQTWRGISPQGVVGLIHLETHFTDESAGVLREETYLRLRRHWEFINELKLFEIQNQKHYGVNIYGVRSDSPEFLTAVSMYHPDTVLRSMSHDGSGSEPGFKDPDGSWDLRPHKNRITTVTDDTLGDWHALLESSEVAARRSRMVYTVNQSSATVLGKLTRADRLSSQDLEFYLGLDETLYRRLGVIVHDWGSPSSWQDVILQGPNFFVCNPFSKYPNKTMAHHRDYSAVDLETLLPDSIPATSYKPGKDRIAFDRANPRVRADLADATRNYYRVMWRSMAALTGERTLIPIIVPPGCSNLKQNSYGFASIVGGLSVLTICAGSMASLVLDFMTRVAPKSSIPRSVVAQLPIAALSNPLARSLSLRTNAT